MKVYQNTVDRIPLSGGRSVSGMETPPPPPPPQKQKQEEDGTFVEVDLLASPPLRCSLEDTTRASQLSARIRLDITSRQHPEWCVDEPLQRPEGKQTGSNNVASTPGPTTRMSQTEVIEALWAIIDPVFLLQDRSLASLVGNNGLLEEQILLKLFSLALYGRLGDQMNALKILQELATHAGDRETLIAHGALEVLSELHQMGTSEVQRVAGSTMEQLSDMAVFSWRQAAPRGEPPASRRGHSVCPFNHSLVVFAGEHGHGFLNDVHVLDIESHRWWRPGVTGTVPRGRSGHTATAVGNLMFVIGGRDTTTFFNDIHVLDTTSWKWTQPHVEGLQMRPLAGHTTSVIDDQLYVFGGTSGTTPGKERTKDNRFYQLDTSTMRWKQPKIIGNLPPSRAGHSAAVVPKQHKIILFGGRNHEGRFFNDVWILHIMGKEEIACKGMEVSGEPPAPRAHHISVISEIHTMDEFAFYVFGGAGPGPRGKGRGTASCFNDVHVLHLNVLSWRRLTLYGHRPPGRERAGGALSSSKWFIFGGSTPTAVDAGQDLFLLDMGATWEAKPAASPAFREALRRSSLAMVEDRNERRKRGVGGSRDGLPVSTLAFASPSTCGE